MRQVFSSARLETVEGVAKLLNEHGIATRIRNGRSYKGDFRRSFSYRSASPQQASLWVIHSDDQPKARQLLREAGLIDSTRHETRGSFVSGGYAADAEERPKRSGLLTPSRLRAVLMVGIAAVIGMTAWWQSGLNRSDTPAVALPASPATAAASDAPSAPAETVYRVEVPRALAETMIIEIAGTHAIRHACLLRDGVPLGDFSANAPSVIACDENADLIDVHDYRTDGSGSGTVAVRWQKDGTQTDARFDVQREGFEWRIVAGR